MTICDDAQVGSDTVPPREKGLCPSRRVIVDAPPPTIVDIENDVLGRRSAEEKEFGIANKIFVPREN